MDQALFTQVEAENGQVWGQSLGGEDQGWDEAMRSLLETLEGSEGEGTSVTEEVGDGSLRQGMDGGMDGGMEWTWDMRMAV